MSGKTAKLASRRARRRAVAARRLAARPSRPGAAALRLDDLLADAGRPGSYLRTVSALAIT